LCLPYHTNCPFGVPWETKWWTLPTFVFTVYIYGGTRSLEIIHIHYPVKCTERLSLEPGFPWACVKSKERPGSRLKRI
ncbi:MAG: hypothetical protein MJE68_02710, partial [Proteobacteria bacterium]|nr:hypothetical protein [Pseudomonadota bacterium]